MYLSQMPNNNYNLENLQFKNTYIILFWREEYRYKGNFTFDWIWIMNPFIFFTWYMYIYFMYTFMNWIWIGFEFKLDLIQIPLWILLRASLKHVQGHNAKLGCGHCEAEGIFVNGRICYLKEQAGRYHHNDTARLRTDSSFRYNINILLELKLYSTRIFLMKCWRPWRKLGF